MDKYPDLDKEIRAEIEGVLEERRAFFKTQNMSDETIEMRLNEMVDEFMEDFNTEYYS